MIPRAQELSRAIADAPPRERDAFVDALLRTPPIPSVEPAGFADDELVGCIPSGIAAVARALVAAEVGPDDVFVDLGSGLGTVVVLAHLLTGAAAVGVEIQPRLVEAARRRAREVGLDEGPRGVAFIAGDARTVALPRGTVFYLYTPFIGDALRRVCARLLAIAQERQIAICCLGFDLSPAGWLRVVDDESMFLTVYESDVAGAAPRRGRRTADPELRALAITEHSVHLLSASR